ncbi:Extracellular metalloprotease [Halomicronema hongdechloris C2206]|uniref:Neutral metalloproteinase n=1 Tax=Halomicronema hongdechloris C2206 TaxID=1641165 RepID=A0A1Z3HLS8_9CYAN|nr:M4 family metallopeptidase [Halomicronema hongdechloris]ASC71235.1 Extracellular metalloprotease [Halomicronema hongdechloris C2206]
MAAHYYPHHHRPFHSCHLNPRECIVPSYILKEIADKGSPIQQERARQELIRAGQFRGQRQQIAELVERHRAQAAAATKQRLVYTADQNTTLPGRKVRGEGDPATGDAAIDEAYDGSGATYDLYQEIYGRHSIDNQGMDLISTVHYGVGYDNAFWNGEQMTYGDGDEDLPEDERLFNRFTIALDIIAHEMTHGVTQFEAGLVYRNQPGALNESFSDVFGALVNQRVNHQTAKEADWLIGAGLFTQNVNAKGIRSMKAPGTAYDDPRLGRDPQPAHMDDIYTGPDDNGGVHINSGIPNRAFYIAALDIGGYAWEKAGRIWYITLRDKLGQTADFQEAARQTLLVAADLFGQGSLEQQAVRKGWSEVGVGVAAPAGNGCLNTATNPLKYFFMQR